jgi:hypothetical protein
MKALFIVPDNAHYMAAYQPAVQACTPAQQADMPP